MRPDKKLETVLPPDLESEEEQSDIPDNPADLYQEIARLRTGLADAIKNPPKAPRSIWDRIVSILVPVVTTLSLITAVAVAIVWVRAETQKDCQDRFNASFQQQTADRIVLAAPENKARDTLNTWLVIAIIDPSPENKQMLEVAKSNYDLVRSEQDKKRANTPITPPDDRCM